MNVFPSTSITRAPAACAMKCGDPPTAAKARTGEFTPPGNRLFAWAKSVLDLRGFLTRPRRRLRRTRRPVRSGPALRNLMAEHDAGPDARALALVEHDLAVDNHGVDADGILKWILEGRAIGDGSRVEQHEIGGLARRDRSTIAEAEDRRWKRRHLADRLLEREHLLLAHVASE